MKFPIHEIENTKMCKFSILFFIGMLFLVPKNTVAGDCLTGGSFLDNLERADLMIRGKVSTSYHGSQLDVEVLEIYRGTVGSLNIQIYNDAIFGNGLTIFSVGTEWIFALNKIGNEGEYIIPGCWINYLKVEASVIGNLYNIYHNAQQRFSLDEFRKMLLGTYSLQELTYDDGVQAGRQQCIDNPAACGITPWPLYHSTFGTLHIPVLNVLVHESENYDTILLL